MESRLKLLKVVELKDLLTRAQIPIPARANKPDLIAKIIDSPAALIVFDELHGGESVRPSGANTPIPVAVTTSVQEDAGKIEDSKEAKTGILAPPEPFDWSAGAEAPAPATTKPASKAVSKPTTITSTKPPSKKEPAPATSLKTTSSVQQTPKAKASEPSAEEDEELKRRRARAERFGIPLVSQQPPQTKKATKPAVANGAATARASSEAVTKQRSSKTIDPVAEDSEKLKARAMRFGLPEKTKFVKPSSEGAARVTGQAKPSTDEAARVTGQKRGAPTGAIDSEEAERRRKRAERFGIPAKT